MSDDTSATGFGKFVPGFDFLQSLAKGAAQNLPQLPTLGGWVAPTLSVEDLDKRIGELKAVQFWLDQNAMALKATIQALEVQKMTLATLKGMNVSMAEVAKAFTPQRQETEQTAASPPRAEPPAPAPAPAPAAQPEPQTEAEATQPAPGVIDAMQWWGALTQQFQQIAASTLQEAAARAAPVAATGKRTAKPAAAKRSTAAPAAPAASKTPARKRAR